MLRSVMDDRVIADVLNVETEARGELEFLGDAGSTDAGLTLQLAKHAGAVAGAFRNARPTMETPVHSGRLPLRAFLARIINSVGRPAESIEFGAWLNRATDGAISIP